MIISIDLWAESYHQSAQVSSLQMTDCGTPGSSWLHKPIPVINLFMSIYTIRMSVSDLDLCILLPLFPWRTLIQHPLIIISLKKY